MNRLQTNLEREASRLKQSILNKELQITKLPEGELKCYSTDKRKRRYVISIETALDNTTFESTKLGANVPCKNHKTKRDRRYLKTENVDLAEQLAIKGLLQSEIKDETRELKAINRYLKFCSSFESSQEYLDSNDDIQQLVSNYKTQRYLESTRSVDEWLSQRSGISAGHEEGLRVKTHAGFNVRSKSERDILHSLMDFGLPYKYEEYTMTDIGPLFPDFTILNPLNGQEVIWEHNGSMDDPEYATKVFKRTAAYYREGYHPGKNFIITYEENNEGIDKDWIETIIRQYFTNPYLENTRNL